MKNEKPVEKTESERAGLVASGYAFEILRLAQGNQFAKREKDEKGDAGERERVR